MPTISDNLKKETGSLQSTLTDFSSCGDIGDCFIWIRSQKKKIKVKVNQIPFSALEGWSFNPNSGDLEHVSGKFFTITGIRVKTNWGHVSEWEQPIINQPEIGILGILTKRIDGILYFLMQAKCEPGNINGLQLSPTLQATRSNYLRVHKGKRPLFLEYFLNQENQRVLYDQLQSEQGDRFLRKRNRNIILEITEDLTIPNNYCWLTLGQIKRLLQHDNIVNMDTRTVISGISFGSYEREHVRLFTSLAFPNYITEEYRQKLFISSLLQDCSFYTLTEILSWFTDLKTQYQVSVERIPLNCVQGWDHREDEIRHQSGKYFSVMAVDVEISNREVPHWTQPMVKSNHRGIVAFITKEIEGVLHFLVQAKVEPGLLDTLEMAPTVQCIPEDYHDLPEEASPPFLDYILNISPDKIRYDTLQSEEGGRFYHEEHRYMIVEAEEEFPHKVPENYTWMTLNQLLRLVKFNNYINVQARSLLASICFL